MEKESLSLSIKKKDSLSFIEKESLPSLYRTETKHSLLFIEKESLSLSSLYIEQKQEQKRSLLFIENESLSSLHRTETLSLRYSEGVSLPST